MSPARFTLTNWYRLERQRLVPFQTQIDTGGKVKLAPIRSPNLQAHVERVIQTIKHEVLNAFCIVTNEHVDSILRTTQDWYSKR